MHLLITKGNNFESYTTVNSSLTFHFPLIHMLNIRASMLQN